MVVLRKFALLSTTVGHAPPCRSATVVDASKYPALEVATAGDFDHVTHRNRRPKAVRVTRCRREHLANLQITDLSSPYLGRKLPCLFYPTFQCTSVENIIIGRTRQPALSVE